MWSLILDTLWLNASRQTTLDYIIESLGLFIHIFVYSISNPTVDHFDINPVNSLIFVKFSPYSTLHYIEFSSVSISYKINKSELIDTISS